MQNWGIALIGVPLGFTMGTLGEYWVHRGMHKGGVLARGHDQHHREGWGQGAFKEFRDYTLGTVIGLLIGLPVDVFFLTGGRLAAWGALGGGLHAFFAAWCHQAQHEDPRLLPWMAATPVHFVHQGVSRRGTISASRSIGGTVCSAPTRSIQTGAASFAPTA
jgi:sterol desaturase/sphingolipid hydroxylase (fatty acid hydroxylase superfamily)